MKPHVREKKHRLPRDCYRGRVVVAFTACVDDRHSPFLDSTLVTGFINLLGKAATKFKCLVPINCFMPDHVHLILQGQDDSSDTWQAMVDFKQQTGFWFGQNRPQDAWQKGFYDHIIRVNEDLGAQVRYIADNPVRWGLVKVWSDYSFTGSIGLNLLDVMIDASTL